MNEEQNRYLVFTIGGESYGTPLLAVREVVEYQKPKFMPNMADHFSGVINIRGSIVGVVDLRSKFRVTTEKENNQSLLICDTEQGPIAAVVDKVEAVVGLDDEAIEKNPPIQSKVQQEHLIGVAKYKDQLVTVIDLLKTLSTDKITKN